MSLKQQITEDMKTAMRAKDTARLGAIRLLLAAMKQREVDERIELSDTDIVTIIDKMMKQRRDSIAQFEAAARQVYESLTSRNRRIKFETVDERRARPRCPPVSYS